MPGEAVPPGLHATYLPDPSGGRLFFWGRLARTNSSSFRAELAHQGLSLAGLKPAKAEEVLFLPAESGSGECTLEGEDQPVARFRVKGWSVPTLQAIRALAGAPTPGAETGSDGTPVPAPSLACWSLATRLALELVVRGQLVPRWFPAEPEALENFAPRRSARGKPSLKAFASRSRGGDLQAVRAVWSVAAGSPEDRRRISLLARALPPAAWAVPTGGRWERATPGASSAADTGETYPSPRPWSPEALLRRFLDDAADALVRAVTGDADLEVLANALTGAGDWQWKWLGALFQPREQSLLAPSTSESHLQRALEGWIDPLLEEEGDGVRGCLVLAPPPGEGKEWRVELALQARADPAFRLPGQRVWEGTPEVLLEDGRIIREPRAHLESAARLAARLHPPLAPLARDPGEALLLDHEGAGEFLDRGVPALEAHGLGVVLPEGLREGRALRLQLRLEARDPGLRKKEENTLPSPSGTPLHQLLGFSWEVALGEDTVPEEEFRTLVGGGRRLVRQREGWVFMGQDRVAEITRSMDRFTAGRDNPAAKLAAALAGRLEGEGGAGVPVIMGPGLREVFAWLDREASGPTEAEQPPGFVGALRPYQVRGVRWLRALGGWGLGGILADDMGLGKTIQLIALLLWNRARHAARDDPDFALPSLVVCPASVLGNWGHELDRFAPAIPVLRHHGPHRPRTAQEVLEKARAGVVLTTYALLRRDEDLLAAVPWQLAVLDEAQNVKNPDAAQARAARRLDAAHRLALTGTPVENRVEELWSISEFVNPGLLGSRSRFRERFQEPIEAQGDGEAVQLLRKITGPFILRRLKTDVALELPERFQSSVFCTLTLEQAALYRAVMEESLGAVAGLTGMKRRGRILALLTRLKQVVNHPAHYLGEPGPLEGRSGKLARLTEMLGEVSEEGERALVFTQYRKMGELLVAHLGEALGREIPFLHGGIPARLRDRMVQEFQEGKDRYPAFVLSLRAGGTGINLTGANHVFHFDRWWNPAVEDQASDRTHRIGQSRDVFVHRFVTLGTLEERIDRILEEKRAMADAVVPVGESWITELPDQELKALVALEPKAVMDED